LQSHPTIADLEEIVDSLTAGEKDLFRRIYRVTTTDGNLRVPLSMKPWVRHHFGSVDVVTNQRVVKVDNVVTGEGALFNPLRAMRPMVAAKENAVEASPQELSSQDLFAHPEDDTPADSFGRVAGKHCVTASNIAKYDGWHGVVIFNEVHPLRFSREQIIDYLDVGWEWAKRAHAEDPKARYFFMIWNCRWRAGASIFHGHAQVMLTSGRHYARVEQLRRAALGYRKRYGTSYFGDLFWAHQCVGCALEKEGVRILTHLSPIKDNETILLAEEFGLSLKERVYEVLAWFRDSIGVACFNLSLVTPPLARTEESWAGFPVMVRLVDRGDPGNTASDVGGMELYAASVIASDPLGLARRLRESLI
jgi:hypothetical protein